MQAEQLKEYLRDIAAKLPADKLPDADRFISIVNEAAPVSVRLHPRKASEDLFKQEEPVPWCSAGRYLQIRPQFIFEPEFHAGAYYVQEASSMCMDAILQELFGINRNLKILDLCGAPGGKSTLLASFLNSEGILVSNEVIRSRAFILKENMDKWGYANVLVSNNDPRDFKRLNGFFDVIVCDAPCSGSGMFRKDPETAAHWSEQAIEHCALRQNRIIEEGWAALKPGGIFIYSTCSYSEAEDEAQINLLLQENEAEILFPEALTNIKGIVQTENGFRLYPHLIKGEGFFISVVQKASAAQDSDELKHKNKFENLHPFISDLFEIPEQFLVWQGKTARHIFPALQADEMAFIASHLYLLKAGLEEGELKGNKLIPSHEIALSVDLKSDINSVNLNKAEAIKYLKKEALLNTSRDSGITLIKYNNYPLGWGNALPNRINNLLPKSWRIRKSYEGED